jgi:hypothetical protein
VLVLHLDAPTRPGFGLRVALDRETALTVAAEVIAHPATPARPAARVPHQQPTSDTDTTTIWRVEDDLVVVHDLAHRPCVVLLYCPRVRPLTVSSAERLAGALAAAADRLAHVHHLTAMAMHHDRPRRAALTAEAAFSASMLAARGSRA